MKAKTARLSLAMGAAMLLVMVPAISQAAGLTLPDYVPLTAKDHIVTALSVITSIVGSIAAIDAFIPEDLKKYLPWWVRLVWDFLGGNLGHSKNVGSDDSSKPQGKA